MEKIWLSGREMRQFINENNGEAMYFTPDMVEVRPEEDFLYQVGLDNQGKNSIVFDTWKL
ncbi:hypothetical protein [Lactobacillus taiwanensis]|uniref:hypothetical protein n=1 Tax=Lactobacillus taiwanensis TaxID=508451 RepID=UPI00260D60E4